MAKAKRVAIYGRVSTDDQTIANQIEALQEHAERAGWEVLWVYQDDGISGAKGRDKRPGFDQLWKDAAAREFDVVAAWSVDRLGRSLQDLVGFLNDLRELGIDLYLHRQGLDTTTPSGRMMFGMLGVFAEFERAMITERVQAGLDRARKQGKHLGRPKGRSAERELYLDQVLALHREGSGISEIARRVGLSKGTVHKWINEQEEAA